MITINLLPASKKEAFGRTCYFYVFLLALLALGCGCSLGYLLYTEQKLTNELRQTQQQHELFKPTLKQMQLVQMKQQEIIFRQNVLLTLTQERPPIYAAVARLGVIIPEGVWLTEVTGDKSSLKISGMANSYPDAAAFMQKAQEDVIFSDFTLIRAGQDKADTLFEFGLTFKRM